MGRENRVILAGALVALTIGVLIALGNYQPESRISTEVSGPIEMPIYRALPILQDVKESVIKGVAGRLDSEMVVIKTPDGGLIIWRGSVGDLRRVLQTSHSILEQ